MLPMWRMHFLKLLQLKKNLNIWNLGSGNPQSINYLIKLLGSPKLTHLPKRPGEPEITYADISKIKSDLNWKPKVSFEKGVKQIIENIDYWKDAPLWNKSKIKTATKIWFKYMDKKY